MTRDDLLPFVQVRRGHTRSFIQPILFGPLDDRSGQDHPTLVDAVVSRAVNIVVLNVQVEGVSPRDGGGEDPGVWVVPTPDVGHHLAELDRGAAADVHGATVQRGCESHWGNEMEKMWSLGHNIFQATLSRASPTKLEQNV